MSLFLIPGENSLRFKHKNVGMEKVLCAFLLLCVVYEHLQYTQNPVQIAMNDAIKCM